jgi:hypothetical protein
MGMSGSRVNVCWVPHVFLFLIIVLCLSPGIQCVDGDGYSQTINRATLPMATKVIYGRLSNLTTIFSQDIKEKFGFCIKDV